MYDCDKGKLKHEIAACVSVCVCTAELCREFLKKKKIMYRSPCGMQLVTSNAIDIYFEFPVSLTA